MGAKHYHTASIKPTWAAGKSPVAMLGSHFFYNDVS